MRQPKFKVLNHNKIEVISEVTNTYDLAVLVQQQDDLMNQLEFVGELVDKILASKKYKGK